ncbi:MAG: acetyl-CoA carboxylase biotin carboxylase subunit [Desulfitobacteriaceae bacterium]
MFEKILIANRGEIAVRIMRTCQEMQIKTVAIYSEVDTTSLHVQLADEAVKCVSKTGYLDIDWIISTAIDNGAQAIHPGYGFLAENPIFAEKTVSAGLVFIGPEAKTIELMGDKAKARETMINNGVPVVPGGTEIAGSAEKTLELARLVGYPVLIKAVAGGGGRGMRLAHQEDQLLSSLENARSEANSCFGNPDVYLEKYLVGCRHIEIQIMADNYGQAVTLGERDCSIQRRHQKLIEESPSPALTPELRAQMYKVSQAAVQAVNYRGAGTLEFLLDKDHNFYFMEMNTRIQVEHTVTELVCGLDLIREQLRIASGEPLGYVQSDVCLKGWAMECRINAEDPATFIPSPGKLDFYRPPGGFGVRVDSAVYAGYTISPFYDSLIGKLLVYGQTRSEVVARMQRALAEFDIRGVKTTIPFHQLVLADQDFQNGEFTTDFIEQKMSLDFHRSLLQPAKISTKQANHTNSTILMAALAAIEVYESTKILHFQSTSNQSSAKGHSAWRMAGLNKHIVQKSRHNIYHTEMILMKKFLVRVNGQELEMEVEELIQTAAKTTQTSPSSSKQQLTHTGSSEVLAPMPGVINKIHVKVGDIVTADQAILTLEAMKMENEILAGKNGEIKQLKVSLGQVVATGELFVVID